MLNIWGSSNNDIYIVGRAGLQHYNGSDWTPLNLPPNIHPYGHYLGDIWGSSSSNVVITGYHYSEGGAIYHFDGDSWNKIDPAPQHTGWGGIWCNDTDIIAAGGSYDGQGVIRHYKRQ